MLQSQAYTVKMNFKISLAQLRILKLIEQYPANPYKLSKMAFISNQTMYVHLAKLELKGLVIHSTYSQNVKLTTLGKRVLRLLTK